MTGRRMRGWLIVILVAAWLVVASHWLPLGRWLHMFATWVSSLGPWGLLVFMLFYVVATVLFVPGGLLTIAAGFLFGLVWGAFVVWSGSLVGAAAAFLIARHLARDSVAKWAHRYRGFREVDAAIGQQGWKIVFLLRLSPLIPFNASNYLYGLTAVRFWPYVLASAAGMIPTTLLYVYLGAEGKVSLDLAANGGISGGGVLRYWIIAGGLVITLVVSVLVARITRKEMQRPGTHS